MRHSLRFAWCDPFHASTKPRAGKATMFGEAAALSIPSFQQMQDIVAEHECMPK